jgi:predicted TIM-barrel fold metal-dependent hydrolase
MAAPLAPPHFRWVPYDDALLFPLDNRGQKAENPDRKVLYEAEEALLGSYRAAAGVTAAPTSLNGYLARVVDATLRAQKDGGAVAIKFEVAYLRSLDFEPATREEATRIYARYVGRGAAPESEYKRLQDFLFRYVAAQAGSLGLVIHIHTGAGCGEYFDDRGSDPMLLEPVLNDPALRQTRFVLLHGGSPFDRHNVSIIAKPNAWVDTSVLELVFSSAELARILRPWLEFMPERVLFGTDAGPFGPGMGWEETTWIGSRRMRQALAIVLSGMVRDAVISDARAREIAEGVLRSNARGLYRWE